VKWLSFGLAQVVKQKLARLWPPLLNPALIILFLFNFLLCLPAIGGIGRALYTASVYYKVPFLLVVAIADVESSFDPLVINVNNSKLKCPHGAKCSYYSKGTVIRPYSLESAQKILKELHRKGYNYDVGLMQINRSWIDKYNLPPKVFLEEEYNALFGAFILRKLLDKYGYEEAIWRYNGNRSYLRKVLQKVNSYHVDNYKRRKR